MLAADGTVFATVSSAFYGAYKGVDKSVFSFSGRTWKTVDALIGIGTQPNGEPTDYAVTAVDLPKLRLAITVDYSGDTFSYDFDIPRNKYKELPQAWLLTSASRKMLGYGTITDLSDTYSSGYLGTSHEFAVPNNLGAADEMPIAQLWHGYRETRLGRGIAFGVT